MLDAFRPPPIDWASLQPVFPAIVVILTGVVALIIEIVRPKQTNNAIVGASLLGLGVAGYFALGQFGLSRIETLAGMALRDQFGIALQVMLIGSCFLVVLFSEGYLREKRIAFGEFYPLVLWSTSGGMLMVSTNNLAMIFIGLEMLSISLYVLAGLSRSENRSEESALKYFLLGAFASAFLLYGMSFLYGASGSLDLATIGRGWSSYDSSMRALAVFGLGMALIGLGFKSAFVPFHQWTPDVYQGAPTNVTAFMAASSKIAAIGALYRVLDALLPMRDIWIPALFWIAVLTMTVGNLVALVQRDVKRILGYSGISHAGYALVAVLAHGKSPATVGFGATAFYLLAYSLMTIGAFAIVSLAAKGGSEGTRLSDLNGLWRRSPWLAVALVVFMASLIGIPGTVGFVGKLLIFSDSVSSGLTALAVVLAVNSVISVYYYLGIALAAFVSEDEPAPMARPSAGLGLATALCAAGVLAGFLLAEPTLTAITKEPETEAAHAGAPVQSEVVQVTELQSP